MVILVFSIPVSMLRQYCFCPRIPFFAECRGIKPSPKPWLNQGIGFQERQQMLNKRRNLARYGLDNGVISNQVELKSDKLGLHGICDAIINNQGSYYPIEFKLSENKPKTAHFIQLVAYAILIEDQQSCICDTGFILYGEKGKVERVKINEWRSKVIQCLTKVREDFSLPILPTTSATDAQCGQCEYLNYCADRF